jgi:hypothetical protein
MKTKLIMDIITNGDKIKESEWSVSFLSNHLNTPVGLIIINNNVP